MFEMVKVLGTISRAEFLLPNLGSLIMGLAWGAAPPMGVSELVVLMVLSFTIINLSSAIGAQANTLSDRELDSKDNRKKQLVNAMNTFGSSRLVIVLLVEFTFNLIAVLAFTLVQQNLTLLLLWLVGISLGCCYSLPPLRLKSRGWLAPISLILSLAIFPVLFAYYAFTNVMNLNFLMSLGGLALTVYGVIIPTEIRDYFGDKAMGIKTMTVRLGLAKASLLGIALLTIGAVLTTTAFLLEWIRAGHSWLSVFLFMIPVVVIFVLRKFRKLYSLSKEHAASENSVSVAEEIMRMAADNPRWIMLVTQAYSFISITLLLSRFLL